MKNLERYLPKPGSWAHTIAGAVIFTLLVISLLGVLCFLSSCVGETKYHTNIKNPSAGRYKRVIFPPPTQTVQTYEH